MPTQSSSTRTTTGSSKSSTTTSKTTTTKKTTTKTTKTTTTTTTTAIGGILGHKCLKNATCIDGSICNSSSICVAVPQLGQPCVQNQCAPLLVCDASVCVIPPTAGQACTSSNACYGGSICSASQQCMTPVTGWTCNSKVTYSSLDCSSASSSNVGNGVSYYGGDVLGRITVIPIFFGPNRFINQTVQFYQDLLASNYSFFLSEYSTPFTAIGQGTVGTPIIYNDWTYNPLAGETILSNDNDIQPALLQMAAQGIIKPTPTTYYPIHYGPNVTISVSGDGLSCTDWIGCHSYTYVGNSASPLVYGHLPDRLHPGCKTYNSFDSFSGSVTVYAHELVEAWTDPVYGWTAGGEGEVADKCAGNRGTVPATGINAALGTYNVVKYYSNLAQGCVMGISH